MKATTILTILVLTLGLATDVAKADFTFGAPQNLGLGYEDYTYISVSADELELYFTSIRAGGLGHNDLWASTRQSVDDSWGPPTNLRTVNSYYSEGFPCISRDGLTLYFCDFFYGPDRPGGLGDHDLWFSTRASHNDPWDAPVNMGVPFSSPSFEVSPTLSHDGLIFIFASNRPGGSGGYDLWMCTRPSVQEAWGPPVNMGPSVNRGSHDYCANLSPDGLVLFFESNRSGDYRVWMTKRRTVNDPWEPPLPLPEPMYSMGVGCVSADGSMFYAGMSQVPIVPVVDLNGDGIVDCADMCEMVDHWGSDEQLYDIGPMPWGDGIVDVQDLRVIAEHLFEEIPLEDVNVDEDDAGSQVELKQGQILVVTLESNPTTGYGWEVAEIQESILEQLGGAEFKPSDEGEPPMVGAGGWEIFRFKAISAGQMTLKLVYRRSWEEGVEPINTFSIEVVVN